MKIIQISDYYTTGTGHPLNNFTEKLWKKGHDVKVYTSNIKLNPEFEDKEKIPIEIQKFQGVVINKKVIYPGLISKILFQENPDVINSWVMGFFSTFVSGYLKPIRRYPLVVFPDFNVNESTASFLKKPYNFFYRKLPTSFADKIIVFTHDQKNELARRFRFNKEKIEVLPIGVDTKDFSSKSRINLKEKLGLKNKFVILNVCSLSKKKNLELIFKSLMNFENKDIEFIHIGSIVDKNYKNYLNKMIIDFGIKSRVMFLGKVSRDRLIDFYKMCDVFLQTGFNESFCIPILEAMAAGKPVITTKVGVASDVIENGKTGFIAENENDIRKTLEMLIRDFNLRRRIGKNAKKVARKYDWEIIIDKLEKIYMRLI